MQEKKQSYINDLATQTEMAVHRRDMKELYDITRTLAVKRINLSKTVKDKERRTVNKEVEQRSRWEEHFKEILNKDPTAERPDIPIAEKSLSVNTNPPSKAQISRALKMLKDGKTPGPDSIPPEALKAYPITAIDMLHHPVLKIWKKDKVPTEWKNGYLVKLPKKGDLGMCKNWRGVTLLSILSSCHTHTTGQNERSTG